jgi:integrative and conjugative element protein (TIGR02256 family)
MIFLAKGRLVTLADVVAQELARFTISPESSREAGGILLGHYRGPHVEILRCTNPMPKDQRTRFGFVRQDKGHQEIATREWLESRGSINFVGEWHTHPERHPTPSWIDRRSWRSQLGNRGISQRVQKPFRHFSALQAIETTTEFPFVGMATSRFVRGNRAPFGKDGGSSRG